MLPAPCFVSSIEVGNAGSLMVEVQAKAGEDATVYEVLLPSATLATMVELQRKSLPRTRIFAADALTRAVASKPIQRLRLRVQQPFSATLKEPIGLSHVKLVGTTVEEMEAWKKRLEDGPPLSEPAQAPRAPPSVPLLFQIPSLTSPPPDAAAPPSLPSAFLASLAKKPAAPAPPPTKPASALKAPPPAAAAAPAAPAHDRRAAEAAAAERRVAAAAAAASSSASSSPKASSGRPPPPASRDVNMKTGRDTVPATSTKAPAAAAPLRKHPSPPAAAPSKPPPAASPRPSAAAGPASQATGPSNSAASTPAELRRALAGVAFSLSGFEGANRASLRDLGKRMGAAYNAEWAPHCTHLVCAFAGTPKFEQAAGTGGTIVTRAWLDECWKAGRRLPDARFILRPQSRRKDEEDDDGGRPARRAASSGKARAERDEEDEEDDEDRSGGGKRKVVGGGWGTAGEHAPPACQPSSTRCAVKLGKGGAKRKRKGDEEDEEGPNEYDKRDGFLASDEEEDGDDEWRPDDAEDLAEVVREGRRFVSTAR